LRNYFIAQHQHCVKRREKLGAQIEAPASSGTQLHHQNSQTSSNGIKRPAIFVDRDDLTVDQATPLARA
jgi:hypothetical protein